MRYPTSIAFLISTGLLLGCHSKKESQPNPSQTPQPISSTNAKTTQSDNSVKKIDTTDLPRSGPGDAALTYDVVNSDPAKHRGRRVTWSFAPLSCEGKRMMCALNMNEAMGSSHGNLCSRICFGQGSVRRPRSFGVQRRQHGHGDRRRAGRSVPCGQRSQRCRSKGHTEGDRSAARLSHLQSRRVGRWQGQGVTSHRAELATLRPKPGRGVPTPSAILSENHDHPGCSSQLQNLGWIVGLEDPHTLAWRSL